MSPTVPEMIRVQAPRNAWQSEQVEGLGHLDLLVYRSNLLGGDASLVNPGGGNTSAKLIEKDFRDREASVLRVKASGYDLANVTREGFVGLHLHDLVHLNSRNTMSDDDMVSYLKYITMAPHSPRPSIETLLHGFIDHPHVDHTHPDVGLAFCSSIEGEEFARRLFDREMIWVPYKRPGFALAKETAALVNTARNLRVAFLAHHGLVTWGETSEDCYRNTIAVLSRCAEAVQTAARKKRVFGAVVQPSLPPDQRRAVAAAVAPIFRGCVAKTQPVILHFDDSPDVLYFLEGKEAKDLAHRGLACPDHIIHTKALPLWIEWESGTGDLSALKDAILQGVLSYTEHYRSYIKAHRKPGDQDGDLPPRVLLIPGIGLFATGTDKQTAIRTAETYRRTIAIIGGATALSQFLALRQDDAYDIEYWPLERYRLLVTKTAGELSGRVALVTGAASGIGRATAERLARAGAHVVLADVETARSADVARTINDEHGEDRALAIPTDVTDEVLVRRVFREAAVAFGGVDIVVNNAGLASLASIGDTALSEWRRLHEVLSTGYFLVAREAFRLWQEQAVGGNLVFVASKNALAAGTGIAAYSAAKASALHLARCLAEEGGADGIRVNSVCPDAVIEGTGLWTPEVRSERARNYGIAPNELESFYRDRTALKVNITPNDVAEAILFFSLPQSAKTTGAVLTVDGGVKVAYVR